MELTVAITGASGTIYAHRTLQFLAASGVVETVNLIMSGTASVVANTIVVGLNAGSAGTLNLSGGAIPRSQSGLLIYSRESETR